MQITPDRPKDDPTPRKTPGERAYDITNFVVANVCIAAATAAIAYVAAYGKDKYGPVPNYLKKIMQPINRVRGPWAKKAEAMATAVKTGAPGVTKWDSRKADFKAIFGGSLTGAVILWWGGTAFAPVMKSMENNREKLANAYNKRFGTKQDVAQAHENLKDKGQQNWWDVLKGRMWAFVFAFSAFSSTCFLLGRVKTPTAGGRYPLRFDWYEDKIGRVVAGMTKSGKEISKTPMNVELTAKQIENVGYRLGKILALDVYATALAVVVWNFFSRGSASKRQAEQRTRQMPPSAAPLPQARQAAQKAPDPDYPSTIIDRVESHQGALGGATTRHAVTMGA